MNSHFTQNEVAAQTINIQIDGETYAEVIDTAPHMKVRSKIIFSLSQLIFFLFVLQNKLDYFNKQGWGYSDSAFDYNDKTG